MAGRNQVVVMRAALAVALLAVFVLASLVLSRNDFQYDLTVGQRRSLAPQTRSVLESVQHPLRLTAFYADVPEEQVALRELVARFREINPLIELRFVDLDRRPELAEEYGVSVNRTVIVEEGDLRVRTVAPGEAELAGAILRASGGRPTRVYFVVGHGEASVEDDSRGGIRDAAQLLAQQNFDLRTLQTRVTPRIPADADVVVLASPEASFSASETAQLTRYLLGGGRLLAMLEPLGSTSADSLVETFGVLADPGFVVDATPERRNLLGDGNFRFALSMGGRSGHAITNGFDLPVIMPIARALRLEQPPPPGVDAFRLLETGAQSWRETDVSTLASGTPLFEDGVDAPGPLGLGFALEVTLRDFQLEREQRQSITALGLRLSGNVDFRDPSAVDTLQVGDTPIASAPSENARLVVLGDVDFINNANLRVQGNSEFFLACMMWLAEKETRLALPARTDLSHPVVLTRNQRRVLRWATLFVAPACMLIVAGWVSWRRRRWV